MNKDGNSKKDCFDSLDAKLSILAKCILRELSQDYCAKFVFFTPNTQLFIGIDENCNFIDK